MTLRMVRCRAVSGESGAGTGAGPGAAVLLLSLIAANVVPRSQLIKHVFEVCRADVRSPPGLVGGVR